RQAADHGAEFQRAEVLRLEAVDNLWSAVTEEESYSAKAVIVAAGSTLKHLGVPGEKTLMGRGVSHCASCDGPLYNGQTVGVVGGGDSALQEALALTNYVDKVWLFQQDGAFSAQQTYRQRVLENPKIAPRYQTVIEAVLGDEVVTGVRVRDLKSGETTQVELAGLFVYVGLQPNTALLRAVVELSDSGHVRTDNWMKTERDGLYAVGDIRHDSARQAITSAGDGATAAIAVVRYIKGIAG
ncbi:MAG TPA: FAD-dependent oxidoreductase, partial [Candidatus Binatia bacterium]|nr:FAD-dependent oxidoreductase [Candidatus Binatia bacterium]